MACDRDRLFDAEELETALESAGVGIYAWDAATNRIRWSPQAARLAGLPARRFAGELEDFLSRVHPEDRDRIRAEVRATLAGAANGGSLDTVLDYRTQLPDGEVRFVQSRGRMRVDEDGNPIGTIGAIYDVSDQRLAAEQLRESEKRYRLFTEFASDYVYDADATRPDIAPTIVAGSFERTTGYTADEVAAQGGWLNVLHAEDRANALRAFEEVRAGRAVVQEYRIRTKAGDERWLRDRVHPVMDPKTGELARVMGGVQDITERKQLEAQLAHAQKLEALARMAGSVAHDFNNLLTVMMGATELIAMDQEGSRLEPSLDELRRAQARATELTGSLLAFARRRPSVRHAVPIEEALESARPMLESAVGEQVTLALTHGVGDACVTIDRGQFEMALLNLAVNARDAMVSGGRLRIETRLVQFDESDMQRPPDLASGQHVALEVSDTGPGVDPAVLPHIFEPFFSTKDGKGTGLGLSSVHGIVHQMRGAIVADSPAQGGARFTLFLPIASEVPVPRASGPVRHSVGGQECVVVVDDEPRVLSMMANTLLDHGYRVTTFESAELALANREALAHCDLLVSDVRLPGMAGTELAERCSNEWPGLAVLLTSGYVEEARQTALIESGRFPFLQKPFARSALTRRVREVLDVARSQVAPTAGSGTTRSAG